MATLTAYFVFWLAIGSFAYSPAQPEHSDLTDTEHHQVSASATLSESDSLHHFIPLEPLFFSDGLPARSLPDTLNRQALRWMGALSQEEVSAIPDTVYFWQYDSGVGFQVTETDSTLRWVQILSLFDRYYERPGAVVYRTGVTGRKDAMELHTYETGDLKVEMEGLRMNSLFSGQVNWNRIPTHKVAEVEESDFGGDHLSRIRLRDHYLVQPRTYLNFDESKHDYRSLEFSFAQNLRKTTNLELSFWDRRDGIGYRRHKMNGSQIVARVYHQLNEQWLLRGGVIRNSRETEEPFGFVISDPSLFAFNRFTATPIESSASSESSTGDLYLQAHYRRNRDSGVSTLFGLHRQTELWSLTSSADSIATDFNKLEFFARQNLDFGRIRFEGDTRLFTISEHNQQNLTEKRWFGTALNLTAETVFHSRLFLTLLGSAAYMNDARNSAETSGRLRYRFSDRSSVSLFGGQQSTAPDIQATYWISNSYMGNSDLKSQLSLYAGTDGEFQLSSLLFTGFRSDIRQRREQIFINGEGQFVSADPFTAYSATTWIGLNAPRFEGMVSGTYLTYSTTSDDEMNRLLSGAGDRIWLKGSFHWKNYLFDKATFVKAGVSGHFSPNPFRTADYIVPLNRWQHAANEWINPSYYRLDVDISARIRWMMVLLKWENVLSGMGQIGYFETTGYPMSERRFRFAIRVLFTN